MAKFRCPYCDTNKQPRIENNVSVAGWIVFTLALLLCFPMFWLGLIMKEQTTRCRDCGMKLG